MLDVEQRRNGSSPSDKSALSLGFVALKVNLALEPSSLLNKELIRMTFQR
jgi:hypothetical protein